MKRKEKLALLVAIFMMVWCPLIVWAHGGNLAERGYNLGGVVLFTPIISIFAAILIFAFPEEL